MGALAVELLGVVACFRLPVDLLPSLELPRVSVPVRMNDAQAPRSSDGTIAGCSASPSRVHGHGGRVLIGIGVDDAGVMVDSIRLKHYGATAGGDGRWHRSDA